MKRILPAVIMLAASVAVTSAQQPSSQPPGQQRIAALLAKGGSFFSGTDRPVSASVVGQFVSWQPGELGLVVLWRGTERWYAAGPQSSSGGGSQGSYHQSNQFGSIRVDLTLNRARLIATVNNVEVSLADGQNVLLVDGADKQVPPSVRAIRADLSSPAAVSDLIQILATSNLARIFRRSAEIVSFLQCDAPANHTLPVPELPAEYLARIYVCEDLKAK
ncbi:MAG: hypothetical protein ACRD3G_19225 [Vicinamibacterales bacterium]